VKSHYFHNPIRVPSLSTLLEFLSISASGLPFPLGLDSAFPLRVDSRRRFVFIVFQSLSALQFLSKLGSRPRLSAPTVNGFTDLRFSEPDAALRLLQPYLRRASTPEILSLRPWSKGLSHQSAKEVYSSAYVHLRVAFREKCKLLESESP